MAVGSRHGDASGGTTIATNAHVAGERSSDVWRGRRNFYLVEEARIASRWVTALGAFVHSGMIAILAVAEYPTWRVVSIGVLFAVFAIAQRQLLAQLRERPLESSFIGMNLCAQLFVVSCATVTGGLYSPFVPALALPSIVSLLFFGPIAASRWISLCNGVLIGAMMLVPDSMLGPRLVDAPYTSTLLLVLGWSSLMLHVTADKLARAASRAGESYDCLREERVAEVEDRLGRLQSVGARVAHELKNPLASIKGLCQLVARSPQSERTHERLVVVESEISRMETILSEYLSFARPLEDLQPEPFDLTALARDVLDVLAGRAEQAGVTLVLDGAQIQISGDPRRLKEALINLVANAIEATPNGGTVQLRVRDTRGTITLQVEDTGRGIAASDLERLGTSYFTTRPDGTGLGVVVAQGVIVQHGGSLAYTSRVGQGTIATITLPSGAVSAQPAARAANIESCDHALTGGDDAETGHGPKGRRPSK